MITSLLFCALFAGYYALMRIPPVVMMTMMMVMMMNTQSRP